MVYVFDRKLYNVIRRTTLMRTRLSGHVLFVYMRMHQPWRKHCYFSRVWIHTFSSCRNMDISIFISLCLTCYYDRKRLTIVHTEHSHSSYVRGRLNTIGKSVIYKTPNGVLCSLLSASVVGLWTALQRNSNCIWQNRQKCIFQQHNSV
jgi:hypothetical protein